MPMSYDFEDGFRDAIVANLGAFPHEQIDGEGMRHAAVALTVCLIIAVTAVSLMILPLTSPEICSSQIALPPLPRISQSAMRTSRPARQWISPRRAGRGTPPPSSLMPVRVTLSAPSPDSIDAPPVKTSLVAPRTPISCVPLERRSMSVR